VPPCPACTQSAGCGRGNSRMAFGAQGHAVSKKHIEECIRASLEQYFKDLRGAEPHSVHDMVMNTVEKPMLEVILRQADGNQSKAAQWLGINRNTLRRKLTDHKLIK
jgi:Fis family transcriptional regulator